jgi:hypothetical protein
MTLVKTETNAEKNTEVLLMVDRPRFLKYGHKAMKQLTALTGRKLTESVSKDEFSLEELEKIIYCGLLADAKANNETLKLEDMEDLLDQAPNFNHVIEAMNNAFDKAFMETEKQKN